MAKTVFVAGARPNFMKVAPVLREMESRGRPLDDVLVHTGQHYDAAMSDVFFEQLGIRLPDEHLQVGSGSHGQQTARIMEAFESYLTSMAERPRGVVVVGDVNSTMACTLVAVKMAIPVAHVEAGLRSFDRSMPEEINRLVTDTVSDLLLVSEPAGLDNLTNEGVTRERIHYVGNVMIDSLVHQLEHAKKLQVHERHGLERSAFSLVTLHRPSNVDDPDRLAAMTDFLIEMAAELPSAFPMHPRTATKLREHGLYERLSSAPGMRVFEPVGYRELLSLMMNARVVVSDSGGIQEETTYLGVPCITLRPNTERPVTVTSGTNTVVGEDLDQARRVLREVLEGRAKQGRPIDGWDGRAAVRIVDLLTAAWAS